MASHAAQIAAHAHLSELNQQWRLLYRASRDGANAKAFHRLCDDEGAATVTVARVASTQRLVGGYTRVAWSSTGGHKNDATAFLFNNNSDGGGGTNSDQITKFAVKASRTDDAVYHGRGNGPCFGANTDLGLLGSGGLDECYSEGDTYEFSVHELTGAGQYNFAVAEVEVFAVVVV